jgi:hypothetical protein
VLTLDGEQLGLVLFCKLVKEEVGHGREKEIRR